MPGPRSAMTEAGCWMAGDVLHNPREALVVRIGMGRKAGDLKSEVQHRWFIFNEW